MVITTAYIIHISFLYFLDLSVIKLIIFYFIFEFEFNLNNAKSKDEFFWILLFWIVPLSWALIILKNIFNCIRKVYNHFKNLPEL